LSAWESALSQRLGSDDREQRELAARELLPLAQRYPRQALTVLRGPLGRESDERVLLSLLRCAFHTLAWPAELLASLEGSPAMDLTGLPWHSGVALAVLGRLVRVEPQRVMELLPKDLSNGEPNWASSLSEIGARAWWQCAEGDESAREVLEGFCEPIVDGVRPEIAPLGYRGAAVATLALACVEQKPAVGIAGEIREVFYSEARLPALYLPLQPFLDEHVAELIPSPQFAQVVDLMVRTLGEYNEHQVHPIDRTLANIQFTCARETVDALTVIASATGAPLDIVRRLPDDWEALRCMRLLIEEGHTSPGVLDEAKEACAREASGGTANALSERGHCLAAIGRRSDDPVEFYRRTTRDQLGPSDIQQEAEMLARLCDGNPQLTIPLIEEHLRRPQDLGPLYEWARRVTAWEPTLLGLTVLLSMRRDEVKKPEARELCRGVAAAVTGSAYGAVVEEWRLLYAAIADLLEGRSSSVDIPQRGGSLWASGHASAASLLGRENGFSTLGEAVCWLGSNYGAWIEDPHHVLGEKSGVARSFAPTDPLAMVHPSVRLAMLALSPDGIDPVPTWYDVRSRVRDVLKKHAHVTDPQFRRDAEGLRKAGSDFSLLLSDAWWDHRLLTALSVVHLRLHEPQPALDVLARTDVLTGLSDSIASGVQYNRACAYAQLGQEEATETHLRDAIGLGLSNTAWMRQDTDLDAVRDTAWFQQVLQEADGADQQAE